jgi:hypothetical protein
MLRDLDLSVAALLSGWLPAGTAIRFDPPAASWAGAPPEVPLLDAFLYDIREASQPPAADVVLARDEDGRAAGWHLPVRKYRVSYLLTAWTGDGPAGSQHELLGSVLVGCATADAIPPDCLRGVLGEQGEPVLIGCAAADRVTGATQLWSSLGVPARSALDLMVLAPVVPPLVTDLAPAVGSLELKTANTSPRAAAAGPTGRAGRSGRWEKRHITE